MCSIEYAHRVHQLLDGDRGMVAVTEFEQVSNNFRRPPLQTIDVDAGLEEKFRPCFRLLPKKGQLVVRTP
ncbi:hypothetical protein D9M72_528990 [compost metagenome]